MKVYWIMAVVFDSSVQVGWEVPMLRHSSYSQILSPCLEWFSSSPMVAETSLRHACCLAPGFDTRVMMSGLSIVKSILEVWSSFLDIFSSSLGWIQTFPREGANYIIILREAWPKIFRPHPLLWPHPPKWLRMSSTAAILSVYNVFGAFLSSVLWWV